jgi:hypothetical protein
LKVKLWANDTGIEKPAVGFPCFAYINDNNDDEVVIGYKLKSYSGYLKDMMFS